MPLVNGSVGSGLLSKLTVLSGVPAEDVWAFKTPRNLLLVTIPIVPINDFFNHRQPLCADAVTPGTYYLVDSTQTFFTSIDNGKTWSATGANRTNVDGFVQSDRLIAAPNIGLTNTAGHVYYCPQNGHVWKSTDGCKTFASINPSLDSCILFGFGAPAPGASYPTIYFYQLTGTLPQGFYQSIDAGVTLTACKIPASENLWPGRVMDLPNWLTGDLNVYGRIYVGFAGSTAYYIDTQDACPWVNFTNVVPNQALTGTATIIAQHSGLVPVTSVQMLVDVTVVASFIGNGPYSFNWNTGSVSHGAHTLTVTATGANGSALFTIPITTS